MKVLSVLLAALTVTSVVAHARTDSNPKYANRFGGSLLPRAPLPAKNRGGTHPDEEPPPPEAGGHGGQGENPDPVANQKEKLDELKNNDRSDMDKPPISKPQEHNSLDKGATGWEVDTSRGEGKHRIRILYGKYMRFHASSIKYHQTAYPSSKDKEYTLASDDEHEENRKASFQHLSKDGEAGTVREEKFFAFLHKEGTLADKQKYGEAYDVNHEASTVVRVPADESTDEGTIARAVQKYMQEHPGATVSFHDNRDPNDPSSAEEAPPLKGPMADGFAPPKFQTGFVAGARKSGRNTGNGRMVRLTRRDGAGDISGDESSADGSGTQQEAYDTDFDIFDNVQSNATNAIFPIIEDMVSYSNESAVWDAAWSLFGMVSPDVHVVGPFYGAANSFASWEDQMVSDFANVTNRTLANQTMTAVYAYHYALIDLYDRAYANATLVLNSTGLLDDLSAVEDAIAGAGNDTSLLPSERLQVSEAPVSESDDGYFVQPGVGNETLGFRAKGKKTKAKAKAKKRTYKKTALRFF